MATQAAALPATRTKLNSNQIKGFWAAWGGWCLDGMDAFIYSLVLVPALRELLPKSGIEATPGNIGYYGAGLVSGLPWLKHVALWTSITFFVAGTVFGIWRYRQEMRRPAEPVGANRD